MRNSPIRRICVLVTGAFITLVFASCASSISYPVSAEKFAKNIHYWDENLPREESVELLIGDEFVVTSYNGIPVNWGGLTLVFLPPGETIFSLDIRIHTGYKIYSGNSIFLWNFKAGDRFKISGVEKDGKAGVLLWNLDVKKEFEEYDFFPFPESGKTVLE
jgi:hypothetical protein